MNLAFLSSQVLLQAPGFTQAWWFRLAIIISAAAILLEVYIWRIKSLRQKQQEKQELAEQMAELHARALRAQMNPHFIFNCLNSIKLLVQDQQNDKAVHYLNVFTKFIRSLMQNADKTHVSLHEELENCRLYLDMEGLRFQEHFTYTIQTDPQLDLKMIDVPVLLIQPLVENALWHGIMPRQTGGHIGISISRQDEDTVLCTVEDNGIGREASAKSNQQKASHQSKGVSITQSRIGLHSLLNDEETTIQITDKKNDKGEATGTRVDITLQIN